VVYGYTVDYASAINNNETMRFARKWIKVEISVLREISQTQKDRHYIYSLRYVIKKEKKKKKGMTVEEKLFGKKNGTGGSRRGDKRRY
jgi:hypothetical protein